MERHFPKANKETVLPLMRRHNDLYLSWHYNSQLSLDVSKTRAFLIFVIHITEYIGNRSTDIFTKIYTHKHLLTPGLM